MPRRRAGCRWAAGSDARGSPSSPLPSGPLQTAGIAAPTRRARMEPVPAKGGKFFFFLNFKKSLKSHGRVKIALSLPRQPAARRSPLGYVPCRAPRQGGMRSCCAHHRRLPPDLPFPLPFSFSLFPFGKAPDGHPPDDTPPTPCLFAAAPRAYLVVGAVGCGEVGLGGAVDLVHNIQTAHGCPRPPIIFFLINSCSAKRSSASREGGSRGLRGTTRWWEE